VANILYLVHRLPYPPNKGDKVRSFHLLKYLVARHRVFLGTFVDDPEDERHVDTVRALTAGLHAARLHPRLARVASLAGLLDGTALTLHYYRDAGLERWVDDVVRRERIDATVVFSSSMAQYAEGRGIPMLVDFVDVDSAKWTEYAAHHRWPLSWLYRREGAQLLAYERSVAAHAKRSFFVTEKETELFKRLAPECGTRIEPVCNGVDAEYFAPHNNRASPFAADEIPLVFTGAMDYWPNADAVIWFASDVLPALRQRQQRARLYVVGRGPTPAVRELAGDAVVVTGAVDDVRPYLQHAAVAVAPLRLARGIQNKVLEAMAMARPVVAARACVEALDAAEGEQVIAAGGQGEYVEAIDTLLRNPARAAALGAAARECVVKRYSWGAHLAALERHLEAAGAE
jgi:sugar transferase (PEP-CTERM/EpsH1 system associated)